MPGVAKMIVTTKLLVGLRSDSGCHGQVSAHADRLLVAGGKVVIVGWFEKPAEMVFTVCRRKAPTFRHSGEHAELA